MLKSMGQASTGGKLWLAWRNLLRTQLKKESKETHSFDQLTQERNTQLWKKYFELAEADAVLNLVNKSESWVNPNWYTTIDEYIGSSDTAIGAKIRQYMAAVGAKTPLELAMDLREQPKSFTTPWYTLVAKELNKEDRGI